MRKLAAVLIVALAVTATVAGGTLMAADPGPIAPGGSSSLDR